MRVLVVEDEAAAAALVTEELAKVVDSVDHAASLEEAFTSSRCERYDCLVLDLSLPDGWGLDTLLQAREHFDEHLPIVVVSGSQGTQFEGKARRAGASAFLTKGSLQRGDLATAVLDAVERSAAGEVPTDPVRELAHIAAPESPVSARAYGQLDLSEAFRDRFEVLAERYSDLLELALERSAFEGDYNVPRYLRELGNTLGAVGATPRDVVQLHSRAIEIQSDKRQGSGAPAFVQESRLVVLELMGYLASYYRAQALGYAQLQVDGDP